LAKPITYYAIIDDSSGQERATGVLRRTQAEGAKIDEVFSGALRWVPSPLLRSAEHGDLTNEFAEISEAEAEQIVARIRASAADER
jgi:hypothetical protein